MNNHSKKIKVLKKNDPESIKILNAMNSSNICSIEDILSRKNMQIQKQFGKSCSVYALTDNSAKNGFLNYLKQKYDIVMSSGNKYFKFLDSEDITTALKTIDHVVFFNTNPKYVLLMRTTIKNVKVYVYVFKATSEIFVVNYKDKYAVDEDDFFNISYIQ